MTLFINGCLRPNSRTLDLAREVLTYLPGDTKELKLYEGGPKGLTLDTLLLREKLLARGEYDHPSFDIARDFASADIIVIASPYWDLAFPTGVRAYLEEVSVTGITFQYSQAGVPRGLCKAKMLIYVTTSGGKIVENFGYRYVKALCTTFYGIDDTRLVSAEGLDIYGADPRAILEKAKKQIPAILE